uniref:Malectin-like domain-containing protein n=1 Tax=Oryza glumipatula TaxID=40148 RepID=A0A0E0B1X9_9ORYZ
MALLLFFAAFLLAAVPPAAGQRKGFLSIDCGLEADSGAYTDIDRGIFYVPDGPYVDAGENHEVAADLKEGHIRPDLTIRSFPSGMRNCYTLPTDAGSKYLVRVVAVYGNYDGKNNSVGLQFNLHIGTNYWDTVQPGRRPVYEALFVAWGSWAPVCLVNTGQGTPFASSVELRPLGSELYPAVMANQSIRLYTRHNLGSTTAHVTRYPNDPFDRYWWHQDTNNPMWENLTTTSINIKLESSFEVPAAILKDAVQVAGNGTILNIKWQDNTGRQFAVFLHFADFQDSQFNVTLAATAESVLPPMLNAYEIYTLIVHDTPTTFQQDVDAIWAIKVEYGIKKNWMGDPCFPSQFKWDGVECRNTTDNILRVISIDLSNSNLHGVISSNFTLLTALEYLNLSGNQLNGPIPDSLCKLNEGSLVFSYGSNGDVCNKTNLPRSKKRAATLAISIAAPVLVVVSLFITYLIWRAKGRSNSALVTLLVFRYTR